MFSYVESWYGYLIYWDVLKAFVLVATSHLSDLASAHQIRHLVSLPRLYGGGVSAEGVELVSREAANDKECKDIRDVVEDDEECFSTVRKRVLCVCQS